MIDEGIKNVNYVSLRMEYTDPNTGKFKKGNPGKPTGAVSDRAKYWQEIGDWFQNDGLQAYIEELENIKSTEPLEFLKRYEAMLEYFKPKLSRANIDHTSKGGAIDIKPIWIKPGEYKPADTD